MGFSPASTHGGGSGLPSQWAADTHGAVIAKTDDGSTVLTLRAAVGQANALLELLGETGTEVAVIGPTGALDLFSQSTGTMLVVVASATQSDPLVEVDGLGGGAFFIEKGARPVLGVNSAPADAVLSAGQCALWFDQTNGAAKLMMKAKQADGTVKTGFVAVIT